MRISLFVAATLCLAGTAFQQCRADACMDQFAAMQKAYKAEMTAEAAGAGQAVERVTTTSINGKPVREVSMTYIPPDKRRTFASTSQGSATSGFLIIGDRVWDLSNGTNQELATSSARDQITQSKALNDDFVRRLGLEEWKTTTQDLTCHSDVMRDGHAMIEFNYTDGPAKTKHDVLVDKTSLLPLHNEIVSNGVVILEVTKYDPKLRLDAPPDP
jgi:hypothetical protein